MTIIISDGNKTTKVDPSDFPHEGNLQQYIFDHPECLPVYEIDDDANLMIICREFQTDHGPIDVLGVDGNGNIYIIETKLYRNPDKRKVIAQLLDYGASLWKGYAVTDDFISAIEGKLQAKGTSLQKSLKETFGYDDEEENGPAGTAEAIQDNLQEGLFRFIVLMDHIDDRLKTLISFINTNSRFTIYAVELKYYHHDLADVVIPDLFGVQVKPSLGQKTTNRKSGVYWNEERFFIDAKERLENDELEAVERLYDYSLKHSEEMRWGRSADIGRFHPKFSQVRSPRGKWWSPYSVRSDGTLVLNMFRGKIIAKVEFINILLKALTEHEVQGLPDTPIKTNMSIDQWKTQVDKITSAIDKALPEWASALANSIQG